LEAIGSHWKPLAISICCACALTACGGGGGDDSPADKPAPGNANISKPNNPATDIAQKIAENQAKPSGSEAWRRIEGFKQNQSKEGAFRSYNENINTTLNGVRLPIDANLQAYYFSGGNGLHHAVTPGGGAVDYYNMSYATFGNYKRLVNDFDDVFYVAQVTHPDKVPVSGTARYNGSILYRGSTDGKISLDIDFSTRNIQGVVEDSSLFNKEKMNVKAHAIDGNSIVRIYDNIYGDLTPANTQSNIKGSLNAAFAGPNAEEIVGELSRGDNIHESDNTHATFGATRQ